jgi:hypothetical protein
MAHLVLGNGIGDDLNFSLWSSIKKAMLFSRTEEHRSSYQIKLFRACPSN